MRLAMETEAFGAPEDHSWLGSRHATDTGEGITLDDSAWIGIFTDGIIPSGVVVAKDEDGLGIPYAEQAVTNEVWLVTPATTGNTTVTSGDETTGALALPTPADAPGAALLQAALLEWPGVDAGDVTVTLGSGGTAGKLVVTWAEDYAGVDIDTPGIAGTGAAISTSAAGGVAAESPAGEATPVGHLFTTRDIGDGTGNTGASYLWHGQVVVANLPTSHGLTAAARALLPHFHYVD